VTRHEIRGRHAYLSDVEPTFASALDSAPNYLPARPGNCVNETLLDANERSFLGVRCTKLSWRCYEHAVHRVGSDGYETLLLTRLRSGWSPAQQTRLSLALRRAGTTSRRLANLVTGICEVPPVRFVEHNASRRELNVRSILSCHIAEAPLFGLDETPPWRWAPCDL
jgi:hypothetical protein